MSAALLYRGSWKQREKVNTQVSIVLAGFGPRVVDAAHSAPLYARYCLSVWCASNKRRRKHNRHRCSLIRCSAWTICTDSIQHTLGLQAASLSWFRQREAEFFSFSGIPFELSHTTKSRFAGRGEWPTTSTLHYPVSGFGLWRVKSQSIEKEFLEQQFGDIL